VSESSERPVVQARALAPPDTRYARGLVRAVALPSASKADRNAPRKGDSTLVIELLRAIDGGASLLALCLVFLTAQTAHMPRGFQAFLLQRISLKNLLVAAVFLFCWRKLFFLCGLYDAMRPLCRKDEIHRVVAACSAGSFMTLAMPLVSTTDWFQPWHAAAIWAITVTTALAARGLVRLGVETTAGRAVRHVIIVGSGPRALGLYDRLHAQRNGGLVLLGFVDNNEHIESALVRQRLLGRIDDLEQLLMRHEVDEVLVALPIRSCYALIQDVISICERAGVQANYLADVFQTSLAHARYDQTHETPVVAMAVVTDDHRLVIKRAIDILGAAIGLVVLSPLMIAIAIGIKLTSPGPIIYAQVRHGLRRRRFRMLKFRTMVANAESLQRMYEAQNEATGPVFKIRKDPRVTRLGAFLRKSSLDELPQLINVLKGDMSLVGPRPLPTRDVSQFNEAWLLRRFSVPQGLTCLWQISGRSELGFDDWVALDLQYIDQWSLSLDLRILVRTIPAVLTGAGAS
jgi:exopolysaccharide biosynthesis polyprenyl glycosylphosphotransferase